MRHLLNTCLKCDDCTKKHWITGKEYLLSQVDKMPTILECHIDGERIVRGTNACEQHPHYVPPRANTKRKYIS